MMKRINVWAIAVAALASASVVYAQLPEKFGITQKEDGARIQAVGRVRDVDPQRATFTLRVRDMVFKVSQYIGKVEHNRPLRDGQRVRVFGDLVSQDRIEADKIEIPEGDRNDDRGSKANTVSGVIRDINIGERRLTVEAALGRVSVKYDDDTEFYFNDKPSGARQFKPGDTVRVVGRRTGLNSILARRILQGGRAGWVNGGVGEVVALDKRAQEIDVDFDGEVWVVRVNRARIRRGPANIQIDELRIGEDVRVSGTALTGKTVDATTVEVTHGRGRD